MAHPFTQITTKYIMTLHAPLDAPQGTNNLHIFNFRPDGWVNGPDIRGEIIAPSGDWLRVMPNGTRQVDVRVCIKTDDGAIIFMAYTGRAVAAPPDIAARLTAGETVGRTSFISSSPRPSRPPHRPMAGSMTSSPSRKSSPSTAVTTAM